MLIYELIEMEMWRTHVKPVLEELDYAKDGTMTQYMVVSAPVCRFLSRVDPPGLVCPRLN